MKKTYFAPTTDIVTVAVESIMQTMSASIDNENPQSNEAALSRDVPSFNIWGEDEE